MDKQTKRPMLTSGTWALLEELRIIKGFDYERCVLILSKKPTAIVGSTLVNHETAIFEVKVRYGDPPLDELVWSRSSSIYNQLWRSERQGTADVQNQIVNFLSLTLRAPVTESEIMRSWFDAGNKE